MSHPYNQLPPNIVRGSGTVTRAQLIAEENRRRELDQARRQAENEIRAAQKKRSGGGGREGNLPDWAKPKKKEPEQKRDKGAEAEAIFDIYREQDKAAEKKGVDLTSAKFKVDLGTGSVTGSLKGGMTAKAKRQAEKDAGIEAGFETFRALKKTGDISQLKTKSRKDATGQSFLQVSGFKGSRKQDQAVTIVDDTRRGQIDKAISGARPEYRTAIDAALIRESKKAKPGEIFDEGSLNAFVADLNFSFDVKKGRGAADDVIYSPTKTPGIFRGTDTFGFDRTMIIDRKVTTTVETTSTPTERIPFTPNIGEQLYRGTVGYGGELAGGILDLLGKKEEGASVRKSTGLEGLGSFYEGIAKATGSKQYEEAAKSARKQAKGEAENPIYGGFSGLPLGVAAAAGSKDAQANLVLAKRAMEERPLEFFIASGVDVGMSVFGGRSVPKGKGLTSLEKQGRLTTAGSFAEQSKEARAAMGLGSGKIKKTTFSFFGTKVSKPKFSKISDADFATIQKQRPKTSIFKNWVNYEPKKQLGELGRRFEMEGGGIRLGAIPDDEVRIARTFSRTPVKSFVDKGLRDLSEGSRFESMTSTQRPKVFGQRKPISIEEELGLTRLDPTKPAGLRSAVGAEKPGAPRSFEGFPEVRKLPKFVDIVKPDVPGKRSFPGFPDVRRLPFYTDIIKKGKPADPFKSYGEPGLLKEQGIKGLDDILKKPAPSNPFKSYGEPALLKEGSPFGMGDILKRFRSSGKAPKNKKRLAEKEVTDLFETLEGKKALRPERDYLTRSEQGRLGDFGEDSFSREVAKLTKRSRKPTTLEDIDKEIRKQSGQAGKEVKGSRGTVTIVKQKTRASGAPSFPSMKQAFSAGAQLGKKNKDRIGAGLFRGTSGKQDQASMFVEGTKKKKKTDIGIGLFSASGIVPKVNTKSLLGVNSKVVQTTKTVPIQTTKVNTSQAFKFKFDFGFKPVSISRTTGKTGIPSIPKPKTPTKTIPTFDIPTMRPPSLRPPKPPAGAKVKGKGRKPSKKGRAQLRTFRVKSVLEAALGSNSKFAKDFERQFGTSY